MKPHARPLSWWERHPSAASFMVGGAAGTVAALAITGLIYIVSLCMEVIWP